MADLDEGMEDDEFDDYMHDLYLRESRRERKRSTKMVMDGAGVRNVQQSLRNRRSSYTKNTEINSPE